MPPTSAISATTGPHGEFGFTFLVEAGLNNHLHYQRPNSGLFPYWFEKVGLVRVVPKLETERENIWSAQQITGEPGLNEILQTHLIYPTTLRVDQFQAFYDQRKTALTRLIEAVMGKNVLPPGEAPAEDEDGTGEVDD